MWNRVQNYKKEIIYAKFWVIWSLLAHFFILYQL